MTRAQQVAQWARIEKPLEAGCARNNLNAKRKAARDARRVALAALMRKLRQTRGVPYGQVHVLARTFGISRRTLNRDLTALFGVQYRVRWKMQETSRLQRQSSERR